MDLEAVFREHERAVYAYFLRVTGDARDAEDLAQETFYRACRGALRYRGDAPIRHWIFGIARNVLLESSRNGLFVRSSILREDDAATDTDVEGRLDLLRALASLELADREALTLVDLLGFTPSEAAGLCRIPAGTMRMRLQRARRRLRRQLEGTDDERTACRSAAT